MFNKIQYKHLKIIHIELLKHIQKLQYSADLYFSLTVVFFFYFKVMRFIYQDPLKAAVNNGMNLFCRSQKGPIFVVKKKRRFFRILNTKECPKYITQILSKVFYFLALQQDMEGVNLGLNLVFLKTQVLMAFFSMYNSDIFQYYLNCRGCLFKRFRIFQFFAEKCSLQAKIIKVDPLLEKIFSIHNL